MDNLIAGALAGAISTVALQPVDVVKVRYQVWSGSSRAYKSLADAMLTIVRTEGIMALYKGVVPAMLGSSMAWGLYMPFYEHAKGVVLRNFHEPGETRLSYWEHMLAAIGAGSAVVMFTNPVWMIKTRMQLQQDGKELGHGRKHYRGVFDALTSVVREEGALALYRGVVPALLLTSHGAIQFAMYEELKRLVPADRQTLGGMSSTFLIGSVSKLVATTVTYPYQVLKARMQQRSMSGEAPFRGLWDCTKRTYADGGLGLFYAGFSANVVRVVPAGAITLTMYELLRPAIKATLDPLSSDSASSGAGR